ncbi:flavanone 3-dioxygenase 3 [Senna tora]|uniref:Flavanone 3-dioxygenase 3 n=1 Tax=Senna tora TaxID=362788 RepID=A0A834T0H0_9FABA|nr:flavanone 3-dioxygenase 3 [Senna tora]
MEKGSECNIVPECYVIPSASSCRPNLKPQVADVAVIDMDALRNGSPTTRSSVIRDIGHACRRLGFFQVQDGKVLPRSEETKHRNSLGMDEKMESAFELVEDEDGDGCPKEKKKKKYRESSFRDFLNSLANNEIGEGSNFIDLLKI